jgi:type III restriction enzyme
MNGINKLSLARNLTARVQAASTGLENGSAPILNEVSDMTAELLRWWFQQDYVDMRSYNFHEGQKQAILNTIYAHEVLGVKTLAELYAAVAPDVVLEDSRAAQIIVAEKNA